MTQGMMTKTERDALLDTMIANEQSRQLTNSVEELRGADSEFAAALVRDADHFSAQVTQRVRDLIRAHPEGHAAILSLLREVLEWLDQGRAQLKSSHPEAARKLNDVDHFERYVRDLGRDILRQNEAR
jgi:hypothetical protein